MSLQRRRQIERLCLAAQALEGSQRAAFIEQACGTDYDLRQALESRLAREEKPGSLAEAPATAGPPQSLDATPTMDISVPGDMADPRIGATVSHYRILARLGQGGMGVVYKAEDLRLRRPVALKFLPENLAHDHSALERFEREAHSAASIDHPFICKIYETGETAGTPFIAMEFIEGESLAARLGRGPLTSAEAVHVITEIAEALAKAHESGIVHRDLKPSNVMLTADGHLKVVDFGIAKRVTGPGADDFSRDYTASGKLLGTLAYMAPEQLCGIAPDARSDLFALGVIFYESITGKHPFQRATGLETASAIMNETPRALTRANPQCPAVFEPLLTRVLSKEPSGRHASAREFLLDLRARSGSLPGRRTGAALVAASIAVLPLVNRSASEEDEYFSDGMSEEIIVRLSKVGGLRVVSLRTAMRFKNSEKTTAEIGRELSVEAVLEGSVARVGDRVRVRVGLTEVASLSQLWAESYERDVRDLFKIQADVAEQIAQALKARFPSLALRTAAGLEPVVDMEAYNLYLKGWHAAMRMTPQAFQQAWQYFQKALDIDPAHARTYAAMAVTYARAGNYGYLPPRDAFSRARAAAHKALEFDADLAEAHMALGLVALFFEWNWEAAERSLRRALDLDPNCTDAHIYYSHCLLFALHRPDEALREMRLAVELDPLSALAGTHLSLVLLLSARREEALEQIQKTLALDPDYLPAKVMSANVFWHLGRYEEGNKILEQFSWTRAHLGWGYALAGRRDDARAILAELAASKPAPTFDLAMLCLCLGQLDDALVWLEQAWNERDNKLCTLRVMLEQTDSLSHYCAEPQIRQFLARIAPVPSAVGALATETASPHAEH